MNSADKPNSKAAKPNRWLLLICVSLACCVCAGLIPGQALFVEMFAHAGVGSHDCPDGKQHCKAGTEFVSEAFSGSMFVSMIGLLPAGLLFDKYGPRWCAIAGATISLVGNVLVTIVAVGAAMGIDASTAPLLPISLIVCDSGAVLNSFSLTALLWYFPDFQTLVLSLTAGSYFFASLLPNLLEEVMDVAQCQLMHTLMGLTVFTALAILVCYILMPTQEEAFAVAAEGSDMEMPTESEKLTMCQEIKKAYKVLKVHRVDHLFFTFGLAVFFAFVTVYTSELSDYGKEILGAYAEEALPRQSTKILTICGCVVAPVVGTVTDRMERTQAALFCLQLGLAFLSTATVLGASWPMQLSCCACVSLFQALVNVSAGKRCVILSPPAHLGTVTGLLITFVSIVSMACTGVIYILIDVFNDDGQALFASSLLGCITMVILGIRQVVSGFPQGPVVLTEDSAAEPLLKSTKSTMAAKCNRWVILICVGLACCVCAGLIPGQALFVEIFVQAGIGSYTCPDGGQGCKAQTEFVSEAFSGSMFVSMIGLLPAGLLFDRYGGRWLALAGAALSLVGNFLVVTVAVGAAMGADASTAWLLPVSLIVCDTGAVLNSFSLYTLLWYFPDFQTLVLSLAGGTYFFASLLPNLIEEVMDVAQCQLMHTLMGLTVVTALAILVCYMLVPTQEEAFAEAAKGSDMEVTTASEQAGMCQEMGKCWEILKVHLTEHIFFGTGVAFFFAFVTVYTSMLSDYGKELLGADAEEELPRQSTKVLTLAGCVIAPAVSSWSDSMEELAQTSLFSVQLGLAFLATLTVLGNSWPMQLVCVACVSLYQALVQVSVGKRCVTLAPPAQLGTVTGLLITIVSVLSILLTGVIYILIDLFNDDGTAFLASSILGCISMSIAGIRLMVKGFPKGPVILPDSNNEPGWLVTIGLLQDDELGL